jgi:hypothetical protein
LRWLANIVSTSGPKNWSPLFALFGATNPLFFAPASAMFPPKDDSRQQWLCPIPKEKIEIHSALFRSQDIYFGSSNFVVDVADRAGERDLGF